MSRMEGAEALVANTDDNFPAFGVNSFAAVFRPTSSGFPATPPRHSSFALPESRFVIGARPPEYHSRSSQPQ
jgi:hypothetical protein